jgi:hypothetical protein
MNLLRTDEFDKLEASIKKNALEQLGLDTEAAQFTIIDRQAFKACVVVEAAHAPPPT